MEPGQAGNLRVLRTHLIHLRPKLGEDSDNPRYIFEEPRVRYWMPEGRGNHRRLPQGRRQPARMAAADSLLGPYPPLGGCRSFWRPLYTGNVEARQEDRCPIVPWKSRVAILGVTCTVQSTAIDEDLRLSSIRKVVV